MLACVKVKVVFLHLRDINLWYFNVTENELRHCFCINAHLPYTDQECTAAVNGGTSIKGWGPPPGQLTALQAFNELQEILLGYDVNQENK